MRRTVSSSSIPVSFPNTTNTSLHKRIYNIHNCVLWGCNVVCLSLKKKFLLMAVGKQCAKTFDSSEDLTATFRKLQNEKFYNFLSPLHTNRVATDQIGRTCSTHQNTKCTYTVVVKL